MEKKKIVQNLTILKVISNDFPFKNIYGDNQPQPPKFSLTRNYIQITPLSGTRAEKIINRMRELHNLFRDKVVKEKACLSPHQYPHLRNLCKYLNNRTRTFIPPSYKAFIRTIHEKP